MAKYRKKPVVVEAIRFTGDNQNKVMEFAGNNIYEMGDISCVIHTLEGDMIAMLGDYIIKGVNGEFYPCKPDVFEKTYEPV